MLISAPLLRAAHATDVHIVDSIDDDVAGVRAADIEAVLVTRHAATPPRRCQRCRLSARGIGGSQATATPDVAVTTLEARWLVPGDGQVFRREQRPEIAIRRLGSCLAFARSSPSGS
jgi:hypothetical protein